MGRNGNNYRNSPILYKAIKKYGYENFSYLILYECIRQVEADIIEDYYIKYFNSQDLAIGYNLKDGGRGGKHSEISKNKIKKSALGRIVSEETREKISKIHKGLPKPKSEMQRKQVSDTMKEWHRNNDHPLLGVPRTEEQKIAQSNKLKNRKISSDVVMKRKLLLIEKFKMTEAQELEIIKLYSEGLSFKDITTKLKINNRKIYRVFKKYNIKSRSGKPKKGERKHSDEVRLKLKNSAKKRWFDPRIDSIKHNIISDYENNVTIKNIMKKYKISTARLYN